MRTKGTHPDQTFHRPASNKTDARWLNFYYSPLFSVAALPWSPCTTEDRRSEAAFIAGPLRFLRNFKGISARERPYVRTL